MLWNNSGLCLKQCHNMGSSQSINWIASKQEASKEASQPASKRISQPVKASKQRKQPHSKQENQPASKQRNQPASRQTSKQRSQPASQPVNKETSQLADKPASKEASQPASQLHSQQTSLCLWHQSSLHLTHDMTITVMCYWPNSSNPLNPRWLRLRSRAMHFMPRGHEYPVLSREQ